MARIAAVGIGVIAIVVAVIGGSGLNVSFMVGLAFAVAASANFPALLLALTWRRFNTIGAVTGVLTGVISVDRARDRHAEGLAGGRHETPARRSAGPGEPRHRLDPARLHRLLARDGAQPRARRRAQLPRAVRALGDRARRRAGRRCASPRRCARRPGAVERNRRRHEERRDRMPDGATLEAQLERLLDQRVLLAARRLRRARGRHRPVGVRAGGARSRGLLGRAGRGPALVREVGPGARLDATRRSTSGSSAASSTCPTTASTATSRPATATGSRSTGAARRARSATSRTRTCTATSSASPTRSRTSASARATSSGSSCR